MTTTIKLTLNGFHGFQSNNVRADITKISGTGEADEYQAEIAESAARKFACKSKDCRCGESMPSNFIIDGYDFRWKSTTVNGNYPSSR